MILSDSIKGCRSTSTVRVKSNAVIQYIQNHVWCFSSLSGSLSAVDCGEQRLQTLPSRGDEKNALAITHLGMWNHPNHPFSGIQLIRFMKLTQSIAVDLYWQVNNHDNPPNFGQCVWHGRKPEDSPRATRKSLSCDRWSKSHTEGFSGYPQVPGDPS